MPGSVFVRPCLVDHLDQLHLGDRVEKVQSDEAPWILEHTGQFLERNTGGVGRQQGVLSSGVVRSPCRPGV